MKKKHNEQVPHDTDGNFPFWSVERLQGHSIQPDFISPAVSEVCLALFHVKEQKKIHLKYTNIEDIVSAKFRDTQNGIWMQGCLSMVKLFTRKWPFLTWALPELLSPALTCGQPHSPCAAALLPQHVWKLQLVKDLWHLSHILFLRQWKDNLLSRHTVIPLPPGHSPRGDLTIPFHHSACCFYLIVLPVCFKDLFAVVTENWQVSQEWLRKASSAQSQGRVPFRLAVCSVFW